MTSSSAVPAARPLSVLKARRPPPTTSDAVTAPNTNRMPVRDLRRGDPPGRRPAAARPPRRARWRDTTPAPCPTMQQRRWRRTPVSRRTWSGRRAVTGVRPCRTARARRDSAHDVRCRCRASNVCSPSCSPYRLAARMRGDDPRRELFEPRLEVARRWTRDRTCGDARPAIDRSSPAVRGRAHTRPRPPGAANRRCGIRAGPPIPRRRRDARRGRCRRSRLRAASRGGREAPARRARPALQVHVGPCAEQPERKRRGRGGCGRRAAVRAARARGRCRRAPLRARRHVERGARCCPRLRSRGPGAGCRRGFPSVTSRRPCSPTNASTLGHRAQRDADQIAMREMHRDHSETGEQERDQQRDAVRVVEAGEQHDEHQRGERQPGARRQDVDAPRRDRDGQAVVALATACPGAGAAAQICHEGAALLSRTAAVIGPV